MRIAAANVIRRNVCRQIFHAEQRWPYHGLSYARVPHSLSRFAPKGKKHVYRFSCPSPHYLGRLLPGAPYKRVRDSPAHHLCGDLVHLSFPPWTDGVKAVRPGRIAGPRFRITAALRYAPDFPAEVVAWRRALRASPLPASAAWSQGQCRAPDPCCRRSSTSWCS